MRATAEAARTANTPTLNHVLRLNSRFVNGIPSWTYDLAKTRASGTTFLPSRTVCKRETYSTEPGGRTALRLDCSW